MTKGYVETTILTDRLLKSASSGGAAARALTTYSETHLPVYAIKEFKQGPLMNFIYIHNKVVTSGFTGALGALQKLSLGLQRYKTASAIQALQEAFASFENESAEKIAQKHGQTLGDAVTDLVRASLETTVRRGWKNRDKVTTTVRDPLAHYEQVAPILKPNGQFDPKPLKCKTDDCCMAPALRARVEDLKALHEALRPAAGVRGERSEIVRRRQALKQIIKRPKDKISPETCRDLGDAVFAIFCPTDCTVLTTNLRDHRPLCGALGKRAENPYNPAL